MDILFWLVGLTILWAALWDYRKMIIPHTALVLLLAYGVVWGVHWFAFLIMLPAGFVMWRIGLWAPGDCKLFTALAFCVGWQVLDLLLLAVLFRDVYRAAFLWFRHRPGSWRGLWRLLQHIETPMAPLFSVLWFLSPLGPVAALSSFY